jgi:hypothetical protein
MAFSANPFSAPTSSFPAFGAAANPFAAVSHKLDSKHGSLFSDPSAATAGDGDDDAVEPHEVEIKSEDAVVSLPEVEKCTGEDGETKVLEIDPFKVFLFNPETKEWTDKGKGLCYARLLSSEDGGSFKARIVVRRKNNEEVVLNAALHTGMKPDKQTDGKSTKVFTFNPVRA